MHGNASLQKEEGKGLKIRFSSSLIYLLMRNHSPKSGYPSISGFDSVRFLIYPPPLGSTSQMSKSPSLFEPITIALPSRDQLGGNSEESSPGESVSFVV